MNDKAERRNVVLAVTGSIAAYKSIELARILVSRGYDVRVIMTGSAQKFVTPLMFQSVTGKAVITDFWETADLENIEHIEVADWADVFVIAPATADILAKLAHGFSDTPLLASALATRAPVVVAPAMNVNMYEHETTIENIAKLKARGLIFVDPEEGALACGWNGTGRLADPWDIFYHIRRSLSIQDYKGKRVLVTTGPTREPIDPVRFISNRSSGKMGTAIAREAFCRGAEVTVIHGPLKKLELPEAIERIPITTATELRDEVIKHAFRKEDPYDLVVMVAAVSDFRPAEYHDHKIKKSQGSLTEIELIQNPDILAEVGATRGAHYSPILVGFSVETGETEELLSEIRKKLDSKGADLIVGNFAQEAFDLDTNRAWIVNKHGKQEEIATTFKWRVANKVLDAVLKL